MSARFMPVTPMTRPKSLLGVDPRIAGRVLARVVRVEVDEAALDLPVADLEHVAPAAGAPLGHAGAPRAVLVLAVAGAFAHHQVAAGEDPVEVREVVLNRLQRAADVAEQLADLIATGGHAPLGEIHLRVGGEQLEDRA